MLFSQSILTHDSREIKRLGDLVKWIWTRFHEEMVWSWNRTFPFIYSFNIKLALLYLSDVLRKTVYRQLWGMQGK